MAFIPNLSSAFRHIILYGRLVRLVLFITLIVFVSKSFGQGKAEKQAVIAEAQKQLATMSSPVGELGEACLKNKITGTFVVDITLQGKGKVLTVFMVSSNAESINDQNFLKNQITQLTFSDIKIPKKERVKFRHTLTF